MAKRWWWKNLLRLILQLISRGELNFQWISKVKVSNDAYKHQEAIESFKI